MVLNTYIITFLELQWHVLSTFTHPKASNEIMPPLDKNKVVSRLAGDGSNQLDFEVLIVRECLCLVVGDFEQYRECELCGP